MIKGSIILRETARYVPARPLRRFGRPAALFFHGVTECIRDPRIEINHHTAGAFRAIAAQLKRCSALAMLSPPWFDPRFALSGGEDKDFFMRLKIAGARFAWADEAVVYTEMPASRASARWAVQRAFRVGNSDMRVFLKHPHAFRAELIGSEKIAGALVLSPPLGLLAAPIAAWRMLPVCKFARAAGKLPAVFGLRYDEYAVTHGG